MTKFERWWRSFKKNVIKKKKFKAYAMSFIDKEYRAQIDHLFEITKHCTKTELKEIPSWMLKHGHKIIYHEYEAHLYQNDKLAIEPIRVVQNGDHYIVVDGNHRLRALQKRAPKVLCEVLV